jgi:hypothetical protein
VPREWGLDVVLAGAWSYPKPVLIIENEYP